MRHAEREALWEAAVVGGERPPYYPKGTPLCPAESREGYGCTRRKDHTGQHVATGYELVLACWNEQDYPTLEEPLSPPSGCVPTSEEPTPAARGTQPEETQP